MTGHRNRGNEPNLGGSVGPARNIVANLAGAGLGRAARDAMATGLKVPKRCTECGKRGIFRKDGRCGACRKAEKVRNGPASRTWNERNVANGRCADCGSEAVAELTRCGACRQKMATRQRTYYRKNRKKILAKAKERRNTWLDRAIREASKAK